MLVLPSSTTSAQLLEVLSPYKHIKIWHFSNPAATFKGIPDSELAQAYQARIDHLKPIVQPMDEEVQEKP